MTWIWISVAIAVGTLVAIQPTLNAEIGRHAGGALAAAAVNFGVGLVALVALTATLGNGLPSLTALRAAPWWAWGGGLIGASFVTTAAFLTPRIGVAALIAAIICGQLAASVVLDHFGLFNLPIREASWPRILGVVMAACGVLLVTQN
jgi:transporter family-2 protein